MPGSLQFDRSLISPPGDTIQEHIDYIGMSQTDLALRMDCSLEMIIDIISGKEEITFLIASKLEKVLGIPLVFWLNRERTYRQELWMLQQS